MRNLLRFKSFNENKANDLVKVLEQPIQLNVVTPTNPVEHKILMQYFMHYAWSNGFDSEDRLFLGGDFGNDTHAVSRYITKDDLHSLMTNEDIETEKMCNDINSLIDDTLIDSKDYIDISCSLRSEFKQYDLITVSIAPVVRNTFIQESVLDRIKMFVELLYDNFKIFKISTGWSVDKTKSIAFEDYTLEEFENIQVGNSSNLKWIQIHVIVKQKIFAVKK